MRELISSILPDFLILLMKQFATGLLVLLFAANTKAQDNCNCSANLDSLVFRVSHNYAGFKDKVNTHTSAVYQSLVDSLQKEATAKKDMPACFPLLEKYRSFFYDHHLQLRLQGQQPASIDRPSAAAPAPALTQWTKNSITTYFDKTKNLHPLEGIWHTEGYDIALVYKKISNAYEAVVLNASNKNWKEGMLKFNCVPAKDGFYNTIYYRGDFAKDTIRMNAYKNFLEIENYGVWKKISPLTADTISTEVFTKTHSSFGAFQFRYLDAQTVYIALKSCDLSLKTIVDSTLLANKEKLKTIPNWIVDFRGNDGGATDVYLGLLPYLYTKPLIERGSNHWMTPDQTNDFKKFLDENKSQLDTSTLKQLTAMVEFGLKNPGGWFIGKGDTTAFDSIYPYPKRVAVLSDKNNASSGETFLMVAKGMSDKVTILGQPSAGLLDYGDLLPSALPCPRLALYIPSRRANYLDAGISYDRTGFPPDVTIQPETKDWIPFVYDYWKTHPGKFIPASRPVKKAGTKIK